MMNFKNEDAVSPVIGVILMVAITVILAAVIAAFVFGMTSDMPDTTKTVAISVKAATGNAVMVTIEGGSDLPKLQSLKLTVIDVRTETPVEKIYSTKIDKTFVETPGTESTVAGAFTVGTTWTSGANVLREAPGDTTSRHVIVVGIFNDGTEQKLADTYL